MLNVLNLSDYKVVLAERICNDKFENDIMLIYNNFSDRAIIAIIDMVKTHVREIEDKGVIFDFRLLNISCTMYLGLAWSMYRKGKIICAERRLSDTLQNQEYDLSNIERIIKILYDDKEYFQTISDIAVRYFTLYLSRHVKEILSRMDVSIHPEINHEENLRNLFIEKLKKFALSVLAIGILDGYFELNN